MGNCSLVSILKLLNIFLVILLVLVCLNPCAAIVVSDDTSSGGDAPVGPAPGQREPKFIPGLVVGGYVLTNAQLITVLTVGTGVVGYATISADKNGFDDVFEHFEEVKNWIFSVFEGILNGTHSDGSQNWKSHSLHVHIPGTVGFVDAQRQYNIAKDSYEDSKRKGIPVPGNNDGDARHDVDPDWNTPCSSYQLFQNEVDKRNGCPKQIRYFNEKGERDMDIDFYHGLSSKSYVKFPHIHYWRNGVRDEDHIYDGL
jgi:hypothetical protein